MSKPKKTLSWFIPWVILFWIGIAPGCSPKTSKIYTTRRPPKEITSILRQWEQQQAGLHTLSGMVQIEVSARGKREVMEAAFLLKAPNQLVLQVLDDLGQEHFRLVADGTEVSYFRTNDGEVKVIPQNDKALEEVFKFPLSVRNFIQRIYSQIPREPVLAWKNRDSNLEITRGTDRLLFHPNPMQLNEYAQHSPGRGKSQYRVTYQEFTEEPGPQVAQTITFQFRRPKAKVVLYLSDLTLNPAISPDKFQMGPLY